MGELVLSKLDKVYRSKKKTVHAVQSFDLTVKSGEIVALLGSSGCGKTSTLRMIAGFEDVTGGSITLDGRAIHTLPPSQRGVAMAFEAYSLYPPLTIGENIAFALKAARLTAAQQETRVRNIAEMLEIAAILNRYPSSVSGGQQQRASLGRALVRKAGLYLLDEPMGQLEPQLRAVLRGRIKHYLRENNCTTILVTHDQTEANALADRIAVMEGGLLQQYATPAELKARPANLFTGTFIGEPPMNVIEAGVRSEAHFIAGQWRSHVSKLPLPGPRRAERIRRQRHSPQSRRGNQGSLQTSSNEHLSTVGQSSSLRRKRPLDNRAGVLPHAKRALRYLLHFLMLLRERFGSHARAIAAGFKTTAIGRYKRRLRRV